MIQTLAAVGKTLGSGEAAALENPWAGDDVAWWELRNLGRGKGKGWRRETSVAVELEKQLGYSSSRSGENTDDLENGGWRTKQGS